MKTINLKGNKNSIKELNIELKQNSDIITTFSISITDGNGNRIEGIYITLKRDGSVFSATMFDHTKKQGSEFTVYTENENEDNINIFNREMV